MNGAARSVGEDMMAVLVLTSRLKGRPWQVVVIAVTVHALNSVLLGTIIPIWDSG